MSSEIHAYDRKHLNRSAAMAERLSGGGMQAVAVPSATYPFPWTDGYGENKPTRNGAAAALRAMLETAFEHAAVTPEFAALAADRRFFLSTRGKEGRVVSIVVHATFGEGQELDGKPARFKFALAFDETETLHGGDVLTNRERVPSESISRGGYAFLRELPRVFSDPKPDFRPKTLVGWTHSSKAPFHLESFGIEVTRRFEDLATALNRDGTLTFVDPTKTENRPDRFSIRRVSIPGFSNLPGR